MIKIVYGNIYNTLQIMSQFWSSKLQIHISPEILDTRTEHQLTALKRSGCADPHKLCQKLPTHVGNFSFKRTQTFSCLLTLHVKEYKKKISKTVFSCLDQRLASCALEAALSRYLLPSWLSWCHSALRSSIPLRRNLATEGRMGWRREKKTIISDC